MKVQKRFNIRVYGILEWDSKVLLSDEYLGGVALTKFPGGGLEWGEGVVDALKREFREELNIELRECAIYYVTDYFQPSAFNSNDQVISIYYRVWYAQPELIPVKIKPYDFEVREHGSQCFRWVEKDKLMENHFYFPIDKRVATQLSNNIV